MRRVRSALLGVVLSLSVAGCLGEKAGAPGDPPAPGPPPATERIELGGTPAGVAVGEGGVWVIDNGRGRLRRVDPRKRVVTDRVPVGPAPVSVAVGSGFVWVAGGDGTLRRVDPNAPSRVARPIRVRDPAGLVVADGSVWVAGSEGDEVLRFDAATGRPQGAPIRVGRRPTDLAFGAGAVWVAGSGDGTVTRIDARSGRADKPVEVARRQVLGLTYGEGRVWVAKTDAAQPGRPVDVVALDPESYELDGAAVRVQTGLPLRLAAGLGSAWATQVGGVHASGREQPPTVARIDPEDRRQRGMPARVGARPVGIAVGEGAVWVASATDRTITRLSP